MEAVEHDGERCEDSLLAGEVGSALRARDDGALVQVRVAGLAAQVRTTSDVVFLAASGGRWAITAAACVERSGRPYDCELEGT